MFQLCSQGAEKKIEIWIIGQSDVYSLEAKTKKAKEDFANELRRVIIEQKDKNGIKPNTTNQSQGKLKGFHLHYLFILIAGKIGLNRYSNFYIFVEITNVILSPLLSGN